MKSVHPSKLLLKVRRLSFLLIFFIHYQATAQSNHFNKYGLYVVDNIKILQKQIKENPRKQMVNLSSIKPAILFDLRYATVNNFMRKKLYPPILTTWLRKPAADALEMAAKEFALLNFGIKIFDAYRPYAVTEIMWEPIKDDRYAADPAKGSGHNRGISVDLTLFDLTTGSELQMPTGFDNFSDTAHHQFMNLTPAILRNREILKTVMEKYGFIALPTEWWHFYLPNASDFELLNISFKDLSKLK